MDFEPTEEQSALKDTIVRFARRELNRDIASRDREQAFDQEGWRKCGEMRLQGLAIPEEHGGLGLDALSTAIALEALGYACEDSGLVFALCAHMLPCGIPIWKHGTPGQRAKYLPGMCRGEIIAANSMTEPGSGSDAFAMQTRAVPDAGGFRINGTKMFTSNAPVANLLVLFAMTDPEKGYHGGCTTFLVETTTPGVRVSRKIEKLGLRTSPLGEVVLEDVWVSADAVLGGVGAGSALFTHSMDWERTCLFAFNVGVMDRLLEGSIAYSRTRQQFGKPIAQFPAIANRLADMKVRLEAARLLVYRAAWRLERSRTAGLDAAIAKLFVSESLVEAALSAVQIRGGYGFMTEYEVERALRDAVGSTIYSGTSEMQRRMIASWLGV
jgi:alkylation response protein AidB-like acyl-CoA dehydrogenase